MGRPNRFHPVLENIRCYRMVLADSNSLSLGTETSPDCVTELTVSSSDRHQTYLYWSIDV